MLILVCLPLACSIARKPHHPQVGWRARKKDSKWWLEPQPQADKFHELMLMRQLNVSAVQSSAMACLTRQSDRACMRSSQKGVVTWVKVLFDKCLPDACASAWY
jgi:hypothetical protein